MRACLKYSGGRYESQGKQRAPSPPLLQKGRFFLRPPGQNRPLGHGPTWGPGCGASVVGHGPQGPGVTGRGVRGGPGDSDAVRGSGAVGPTSAQHLACGAVAPRGATGGDRGGGPSEQLTRGTLGHPSAGGSAAHGTRPPLRTRLDTGRGFHSLTGILHSPSTAQAPTLSVWGRGGREA